MTKQIFLGNHCGHSCSGSQIAELYQMVGHSLDLICKIQQFSPERAVGESGLSENKGRELFKQLLQEHEDDIETLHRNAKQIYTMLSGYKITGEKHESYKTKRRKLSH